MEYRIDDRELDAGVFIAFVNQVWPGNYDEHKTANFSSWPGSTLPPCCISGRSRTRSRSMRRTDAQRDSSPIRS